MASILSRPQNVKHRCYKDAKLPGQNYHRADDAIIGLMPAQLRSIMFCGETLYTLYISSRLLYVWCKSHDLDTYECWYLRRHCSNAYVPLTFSHFGAVTPKCKAFILSRLKYQLEEVQLSQNVDIHGFHTLITFTREKTKCQQTRTPNLLDYDLRRLLTLITDNNNFLV